MRKIEVLKDKIFRAETVNKAEDLANEWVSHFLKERTELRSNWHENGLFVVKATVVTKIKEVM